MSGNYYNTKLGRILVHIGMEVEDYFTDRIKRGYTVPRIRMELRGIAMQFHEEHVGYQRIYHLYKKFGGKSNATKEQLENLKPFKKEDEDGRTNDLRGSSAGSKEVGAS